MGEAYSLPLPVTLGCDYNACLFCDLNRTAYYEFSREEIQSFIDKLTFIHQYDRKPPQRVVLLQANPFCLATDKLLWVAEYLKYKLPSVQEIACFARVQDVLNKRSRDLVLLREAGYVHLTLGLESGSDKVLLLQRKGVTQKQELAALHKLKEAQITCDAYIMLGLGGRDLSRDHVAETAKLLNQVDLKMLIVVTTVLFKGAKLVELVRNKTFKRLSPLESMEEMANLLQRLEGPCIFNASHKTNYFSIKGLLPDQKDVLLNRLNTLIQEDRGVHQGLREARRWESFSTEE